ncbi:MAG: hypothetical protein HW389_664 [Bacteroidetes bacterium]|jgi:hypothetical protein|nr:hypothetical protein [Bacteroidota bacterium]MDP2886996.1 hypothetical protein [Ignavibacteria bacterium]
MGQQQILLVIVGVIIVGLAIAVGIALFGAQSVASNRDAMITDLQHISLLAYQYRITLRTMAGGQGDYSLFVIPSQMTSNSNGTYSITDAQPNTLTLQAVSANSVANTITVIVDSQGKLGSLTFGGEFQ